MKKDVILKIVVSVLLLVVAIIGVIIYRFVSDKEPINVYLFWGNGCPHCENAKEFFSEIEDEYGKYFELVQYEVWYDQDNKSLYKNVKQELNDTADGVPFIVIGDKTFRGYSSAIDQEIKDTILEKYEDENYVDIVEKVK